MQVTRFVTRWALTQGILELEGEYTQDGKYFRSGHIFVSRDEAFQDLEQAKTMARTMAKNKVHKLKKQIERLEEFVPKVVKA